MDMYNNEEKVVLCAANAYNQKYYLNSNFAELPEGIQEELQIMCVMFTEDVGGILQIAFNSDGELEFETSCEEGDFFYDEIGSVLKIKQYRNEKRDLLEALEMYYKVRFLGQGFEERSSQ
jgi:hypothetical protein